MLRVSAIVLSTLVSVSACKKGEDSAPKASEGAGSAAPATPAAPTPTALGPLGLQMDVPAGAKVEDTSVDAPAVTVEAAGCKVMVSTTTEAYADNFDAAKREVQKDPNPFKQFSKEEQGQGGWHLEYELASMLDKTPLYGVQIRRTFGDKQIECGINVPTTAERDCAARACLSLRQ
jgi:hypothetical protein